MRAGAFFLFLTLVTFFFILGCLEPSSAKEWYDKGLALIEESKYEEALEAFDKAIQINPNYGYAKLMKIITLRILSRCEEADLELLEHANMQIHNNPSMGSWLEKTTALINLGRYDEALDAINNTIQYEPDNNSLWSTKGFLLNILGKKNEALKYHEKSVQNKTDDFAALQLYAITLNDLGRHEDALIANYKAAEINPDCPEIWENIGYTLSKLEKNTEAIEAYKKTIQLNPEYGRGWYKLGDILKKLGRDWEAKSAFSKAKELGVGKNCSSINYVQNPGPSIY